MVPSELYNPYDPEASPAECLEGTIETHMRDLTQLEREFWHKVTLAERPGACFLYYERSEPVHAPRVKMFGEMPPGTRVRLHIFGEFNSESRDEDGRLEHLLAGIEALGDDGTVVCRTRNDVACVYQRGTR